MSAISRVSMTTLVLCEQPSNEWPPLREREGKTVGTHPVDRAWRPPAASGRRRATPAAAWSVCCRPARSRRSADPTAQEESIGLRQHRQSRERSGAGGSAARRETAGAKTMRAARALAIARLVHRPGSASRPHGQPSRPRLTLPPRHRSATTRSACIRSSAHRLPLRRRERRDALQKHLAVRAHSW